MGDVGGQSAGNVQCGLVYAAGVRALEDGAAVSRAIEERGGGQDLGRFFEEGDYSIDVKQVWDCLIVGCKSMVGR